MTGVYSISSVVAALLLVSICAATDLLYRRIPNVLTIPGLTVGLILGTLSGGWNGLLIASGGVAVGFGLMFLPYYLGGMGAGDVKLMAALGALAGVPAIVDIFLYTALAGGALALISAARHGVLGPALKNAFGIVYSAARWRTTGAASQSGEWSHKKSVGAIPYGVAIAAGTIAHYALGSLL